ncbi:MAG: hypothetical protein GY777_17340 [Candidatus Brocadiaceae bacterium]|nr:hypothetical protein [Candidatus Brocadiaceae bacterium]
MAKSKSKTLDQLNDELQIQLIEEQRLAYEEDKKLARIKSDFKIGDIVRSEVQGKIQAFEVVDVIHCEDFDDPEGDYTITQYEIKAVYGRVFNKMTFTGNHPDCRNEEMTIIQRAS